MFVFPKHQAACVLMFHLQKDEFPVDTHVSSRENYRCYSFTLCYATYAILYVGFPDHKDAWVGTSKCR